MRPTLGERWQFVNLKAPAATGNRDSRALTKPGRIQRDITSLFSNCCHHPGPSVALASQKKLETVGRRVVIESCGGPAASTARSLRCTAGRQ